MPAIHPSIVVRGAESGPHTPGFAAAAASSGGDDAAIDGATALALTVAEVASDPDARRTLLERSAMLRRHRA